MRAFIACDIQHPGISRIVDDIKETVASIRYVDPERAHVTLKFLGDIAEESIEPIGNAIKSASGETPPLTVKLRGIGVFPSMSFMRVIWIGLICPELIHIQKRLDKILAAYGFKKEKNWKPHLTLGRVKSPADKVLIREIVERLKDVEIGSVEVDSIKLKKSELRPGGPIYTDLVEIAL